MASANRLHLDFKLTTTDERQRFIHEYLRRPEFTSRPPTEEELETMGNYLLWGKDPETGLNAKQAGVCDIETKHGTWDKSGIESLEGLMEQPTFTEASLFALGAAPTKVKREVFSRQSALDKCPDYLRDTFLDLFQRIDRLELAINYYELLHGKRKNPPRDALVAKFSDEEQESLREWVTHWNQYQYLKHRHQLVELRREQYTLRDSYSPVISGKDSLNLEDQDLLEDNYVDFGVEVKVLPMGMIGQNGMAGLVFDKWAELTPYNRTEGQLEQISRYYWERKNDERTLRESKDLFIDFRELEHVYQLFMYFFELEDSKLDQKPWATLTNLMDTLKFYVERADLTELQRELLDMKLRKITNVDIAKQINEKWKKTYTPNYISTIFRQRIIPKINEAAAYHEKLIGNIFFEEEYKRCTGCGEFLLRDTENFTRRSRSVDGFTTRCKRCEKKSRNKGGKDVI